MIANDYTKAEKVEYAEYCDAKRDVDEVPLCISDYFELTALFSIN